MTSELGPTARSLLDAARAGLSPDAAAIRRVRAGLDATLGATAASTTTATTTATTTTTATETTTATDTVTAAAGSTEKKEAKAA